MAASTSMERALLSSLVKENGEVDSACVSEVGGLALAQAQHHALDFATHATVPHILHEHVSPAVTLVEAQR